MTEQNRKHIDAKTMHTKGSTSDSTATSTPTNGPPKMKYATRLPVVIQIKLKTNDERYRLDRRQQQQQQRRPRVPPITSDTTTNTDIDHRRIRKPTRIMRPKQRHQQSNENQFSSSDICQCDSINLKKWQIFDRTPYRRHLNNNSYNNSPIMLSNKQQPSSDDSYCRCDANEPKSKYRYSDARKKHRSPINELAMPKTTSTITPTTTTTTTSTIPATTSTVRRKHVEPIELEKLPNENHQSNGHSQSGTIHYI